MPSESTTAGASSVFSWPVRIYYEDTDAGGIVYHANYLRYFERARTEWLRMTGGVSQAEIARAQDQVFVVRALAVDYRRPAALDDLLQVELAVAKAGRASVELRQWAVREGEREPLVDARVRLAMIRRDDGRPVRLPDWFVSFLETGTTR